MKYLMSASVAQHEFSTHLPAELSESKAEPQLELSDLRKRKSEAENLRFSLPNFPTWGS